MAPFIPSAKATLAYPLFACEFDPLDSTRLFVGGGGGAGRSGVPNKIVNTTTRLHFKLLIYMSKTVLDTSNPADLVETGEVDLSRNEDSVTSIAVAPQTTDSTLVFAGVNSSPQDIADKKNRHFRTFEVRKSAMGAGETLHTITESSRKTVFTGLEKDLYQRVTRLSRPYTGQTQIGAVTTGLAHQSEVIIFDAKGASPRIIGGWQSDKEAVDCDFLQIGKDEYLFAYCDEHDVWLTRVLQHTVATAEPQCIYVTPIRGGGTPSIKAMRWLTKDYIALLTNLNGGGVMLDILRLPPPGKSGQSRIIKSTRLPFSVSKSTGFAVVNLTPPLTPESPQDFSQFVIAVAGHDISITLYKVDLKASGLATQITQPAIFRTLKNVHPIQITSLSFSSFSAPTTVTANTPPQTLKLASTSLSNTVVVHTIPLFPVPLSVQRGQSKVPRYVVALPSRFAIGVSGSTLAFIILVLSAIAMDSLLDIWGGPPSKLGIPKYIPIQWQHKIGKPYEFPSGYSGHLNRPAPTSANLDEFEDVPQEKTIGHSLPAPTSAYGTEFEEIPGETEKPAGHSLPAPTSAVGDGFEDIPGDKPAGHSLPAPTSAQGDAFEEIPSDKAAGHSLPAPTSAVGDGFEEIPTDKPAGHSLPAPTSAYGTEFESEPATVVPIPAHGFDETGGTLQDLLKKVQAGGGDGVVIINDATGDIKAELHDEEIHGPAHKSTTWEKLTAEQREGWKKKLSDAGHWAEEWAEETGNAIWKGVLFSEIAGAIGQAVAG